MDSNNKWYVLSYIKYTLHLKVCKIKLCILTGSIVYIMY
jgi:hypothetical protein